MPNGQQRKLLLSEIDKGYREYLHRAIKHTEQFDTLVLENENNSHPLTPMAADNPTPIEVEQRTFAEVVSRYFDELQRTNAL